MPTMTYCLNIGTPQSTGGERLPNKTQRFWMNGPNDPGNYGGCSCIICSILTTLLLLPTFPSPLSIPTPFSLPFSDRETAFPQIGVRGRISRSYPVSRHRTIFNRKERTIFFLLFLNNILGLWFGLGLGLG
jgi:hypothetical protein